MGFQERKSGAAVSPEKGEERRDTGEKMSGSRDCCRGGEGSRVGQAE